jgi:hypothetical protein
MNGRDPDVDASGMSPAVAALLEEAREATAWRPPPLAPQRPAEGRPVDADPRPPRPSPRGSVTSQLVALALGEGTVSHNAAGTPYLRVRIHGERHWWPLPSRAARQWLAASFFNRTGAAPPRRALTAAVEVLAGLGRRSRRPPGPEAAAVARLSTA